MNLCYGSRAVFYHNSLIYGFSPLGIFPRARSPAINGRKQNGTVCDFFGAGGALCFDTVAAQTVIRLKDKYPKIRLILVLSAPTKQNFGTKMTAENMSVSRSWRIRRYMLPKNITTVVWQKKQTPCR